MMSIAETLAPAPPPVRLDPDGTLRVGHSRVLLEMVIRAFLKGDSADEIAYAYSTLSLADAHGAIAYYLEHSAELDAYMVEHERVGRSLRQEIEAYPPTSELRQRLLAARERDDVNDPPSG